MFVLGEKTVNQRKHEIVNLSTCWTIKGSEGLLTTLNGIMEIQILEVTSMGLFGCNLKEKLYGSNGIHKGTI